MIPSGSASTRSAAADIATSIVALDDAVEALERHVVDVDDRHAVEILEAGAQRNHLQQVGNDLDVEHLAARALDQLDHAQVLFRRQRHVQVIDRFALGDLRRFVDRAEQRQPAVSEVIAGGAIVDEPDDLIAELAVLDDLVGDEAAQLAGSRNQDPLQTDAGAPPALEHVAHELARE